MDFERAMILLNVGLVILVIMRQQIILWTTPTEKVRLYVGFDRRTKRIMRTAWWCFIGAVFIVQYRGNSILNSQFAFPMWLRIAGTVVNILGTALILWSHAALGKNWNGKVRIREGHELVTSGPFRYVRHPLYLGFHFINFGAALATQLVLWILIFPLMVIMYELKARQEERLLWSHFKKKYRQYHAHTWRYIPYVY